MSEVVRPSIAARVLAIVVVGEILLLLLYQVDAQLAVDSSELRRSVAMIIAIDNLFTATILPALLIYGWRSFRTGQFPAPGASLPWKTVRTTGARAKVVGLVCLLLAAFQAMELWRGFSVLRSVLNSA